MQFSFIMKFHLSCYIEKSLKQYYRIKTHTKKFMETTFLIKGIQIKLGHLHHLSD